MNKNYLGREIICYTNYDKSLFYFKKDSRNKVKGRVVAINNISFTIVLIEDVLVHLRVLNSYNLSNIKRKDKYISNIEKYLGFKYCNSYSPSVKDIDVWFEFVDSDLKCRKIIQEL